MCPTPSCVLSPNEWWFIAFGSCGPFSVRNSGWLKAFSFQIVHGLPFFNRSDDVGHVRLPEPPVIPCARCANMGEQKENRLRLEIRVVNKWRECYMIVVRTNLVMLSDIWDLQSINFRVPPHVVDYSSWLRRSFVHKKLVDVCEYAVTVENCNCFWGKIVKHIIYVPKIENYIMKLFKTEVFDSIYTYAYCTCNFNVGWACGIIVVLKPARSSVDKEQLGN